MNICLMPCFVNNGDEVLYSFGSKSKPLSDISDKGF